MYEKREKLEVKTPAARFYLEKNESEGVQFNEDTGVNIVEIEKYAVIPLKRGDFIELISDGGSSITEVIEEPKRVESDLAGFGPKYKFILRIPGQ